MMQGSIVDLSKGSSAGMSRAEGGAAQISYTETQLKDDISSFQGQNDIIHLIINKLTPIFPLRRGVMDDVDPWEQYIELLDQKAYETKLISAGIPAMGASLQYVASHLTKELARNTLEYLPDEGASQEDQRRDNFSSENLDRPLDLTKRQFEIFSYIFDYRQQHGFSPTLREICEEFSFSDPAARQHIDALVKKGYLQKLGMLRERNIRITEQIFEYLA